MPTRRPIACSLLYLFFLQTACSTYRPASLAGITPGTHIRVRFSSPAVVAVTDEHRSPSRHYQLSEPRAVEGKLLRTVGDTVQLAPVWLLSAAQLRPFPSGSFAVHPSASVTVRQSSPGRTALLLFGIGAIISAFAIAAGSGIRLDNATIW